jgi:hypothetical protein
MINKNKPASVKQKEGFVEITFSENMPKEAIKAQVEECQAATCECCTPEFREKVTEFDTSELNNNKVKVYGTIAEDEVEKNIISCAPNLKK